MHGTPRTREKLGVYPHMTLKIARQHAVYRLYGTPRRMATGPDDGRNGLETFISVHPLKPRTRDEYQRLLEKHFSRNIAQTDVRHHNSRPH